jgi:hypothetical protein
MARKKTKSDAISTKKDTRYLKYTLTEQEVSDSAQDLAQHLGDMESLENELKAIKADMKAKIEKCTAEIKIAQRLVRDKYEMRLLPVTVESNYTQCTVVIIRDDTGEVVRDRKMTGEEKQQTMDFEGAD